MKLQPNFSWQAYEGKTQADENAKQFEYQLQREHIVVANSINTTIDDESYFTNERITSFAWFDGSPIYTKTFIGTITNNGSNPFLHGITNLNYLISLTGSAQNAVPMTTFGFPLPYVDPITTANGIALEMNTTVINVKTGNAFFVGYKYAVTIHYTKVRP